MSKAKKAGTAAKAKTPAAILGENLGNGEGAQKLCYVLFLADYDDDLALFLADVGAIMARADAMKGEAKLTEEDRVILRKSDACYWVEWSSAAQGRCLLLGRVVVSSARAMPVVWPLKIVVNKYRCVTDSLRESAAVPGSPPPARGPSCPQPRDPPTPG